MEPSTENQHRKKGTYGFTHMKPSDGNQHRKKKHPLLLTKASAFVSNSLPHKSFRCCSPMLEKLGTIYWFPGNWETRPGYHPREQVSDS